MAGFMNCVQRTELQASCMRSQWRALEAVTMRCPSIGASASVASWIIARGCLGMTSTCTGACGLMSWKASTISSSYAIFAGISFRMI
eukprot:scaffold301078_cov33-Tisochrysis_lutea.AAC.1